MIIDPFGNVSEARIRTLTLFESYSTVTPLVEYFLPFGREGSFLYSSSAIHNLTCMCTITPFTLSEQEATVVQA